MIWFWLDFILIKYRLRTAWSYSLAQVSHKEASSTFVYEFIGVSCWLVASANCSGRAIQFAYQLMIGFCLDLLFGLRLEKEVLHIEPSSTFVNKFIGVSCWLVASANCSGRVVQSVYQLMIRFWLDFIWIIQTKKYFDPFSVSLTQRSKQHVC